jgi:hypothetical protein
LTAQSKAVECDDSALVKGVELAAGEALHADETPKRERDFVGRCGGLLTAEELAAYCSSSASDRVLATDLEDRGAVSSVLYRNARCNPKLQFHRPRMRRTRRSPGSWLSMYRSYPEKRMRAHRVRHIKSS